MKAWFVFRDGVVYGSQVGYSTREGAVKSLRFNDDYNKLIKSYGDYLRNDPPEKNKEFYFKYDTDDPYWHLNRTKWSKKIWQKYVKDHYKILEKEFEIVFKN